jgi:subtilisin
MRVCLIKKYVHKKVRKLIDLPVRIPSMPTTDYFPPSFYNMVHPLFRRLSALLLSAGIFTGTLSPVFAQDFTLPEGAYRVIPGQYIVTLKDGALIDTTSILREHKIADLLQFSSALKGFASTLSDKQLKELQNDPRVAAIEPDVEVYAFGHNLPSRQGNWWDKYFTPKPTTSTQTIPTGINRIDADASTTAKINGVDERVDIDVAVIDTGVEKSHPDLNVYKQVKYTSESSLDDKNGHGTHVAGTIGALDNTIGVVGVAPGARIWSVKVLNAQGSGNMSDIIKGIDYVTANASSIEVANMSLGCECTSSALNTAITNAVNAGVTVVVAAGNSAKDSTTFSPANHPDVITVSALTDFNGLPGGGAAATCYNDGDDTFATFSNFGSPVDIAAPGVCIKSTWKGSGYNTISGTSMASPHVAGAAALYIAKNGKPTNASGVANVRSALMSAGWTQSSSNGFSGDPDSGAEPLLNVSGF